MTILDVRNLQVSFKTPYGTVRAVDDVSFQLAERETLGVVGESGCGKSVTALAILGLLPPGGAVTGGSVLFDGRDLLSLPRRDLRSIRGNEIGMIFQDPMTSLNPLMTVGDQISEGPRLHLGMSAAAAKRHALEWLDRVGIPEPRKRYGAYPHEFSGGMRQRVMIATALACAPRLVIADEITTALDVTMQAQILDILVDLASSQETALMIITHDLGVIARMADRVNVMYAGQVVESAPVGDIFTQPAMPYTWGLLSSVPQLDGRGRDHRLTAIRGVPPNLIDPPAGCRFASRCGYARDVCSTATPPLTPRLSFDHHSARCHATIESAHGGWLSIDSDARASDTGSLAGAGSHASAVAVSVTSPAAGQSVVSDESMLFASSDLTVHFPKGRRRLDGSVPMVRAVDGVTLDIRRAEAFGLVGESGSGKSTLGRAILQLYRPTAGRLSFDGKDLLSLNREESHHLRRRMQMVFQDPYSSLNPRMTVGKTIAEPLVIHDLLPRSSRKERVAELLLKVGLDPSHATRYPHEFSGGQRQRIGIARALAAEPDFIVADEPVSALDVSVQAQLMNLMLDLQRDLGLTYLFIAHDLAVVAKIAHRVGVMYLGKLVEIGETNDILISPTHPYTVSLLSAVATPDPKRERLRKRIVLEGDIPSPIDPPSGCRFHTRCWLRGRLGGPARCATDEPPLNMTSSSHAVACHFPEESRALAAEMLGAGLPASVPERIAPK